MPMPLMPDIAVFQRKLATLPLTSDQAGDRSGFRGFLELAARTSVYRSRSADQYPAAQLVTLAARHALPPSYFQRDHVGRMA
jgi:hypothetical protein